MPIQIIGSTHGNIIEMTEEFARGSDGVLVLNGTGNVIRISTRRPSFKALIDVDRGNTFELGERSYVGNLNVHLRGGSRATVGADVYAIAVCKLFCHETSSIGIGNGCLIGDQTAIMTSDMHSIVEAATSKRVNPPGNIEIGERVWIGAEVYILKNTRIGSGSFVGLRSVVMGEFPPDCMILGYPARLVRSGITWRPELLPLEGEAPRV